MPHTLQSVVLFDSLNTDFDITYILMLNNESSWEKVPIQAMAEQGVASLLNYKMLASDQLQVKVSVTIYHCWLGDSLVGWVLGDCEASLWAPRPAYHLPVWFLPHFTMHGG